MIHRDLKPENIIIGKYGEVLILDWGLAQLHDAPPDDDSVAIDHLPVADKNNMTRAGKVVGTVAYMAPERAIGHPATIQTDIYSLGVILYQILTLRPPFKRGTLDEFRVQMHDEEWVDPVLAAPYRDVPRMLARFTEKCMALDLSERYKAVDELIRDLENYIEGRSEWFKITQLDVNQKSDWEFQENILIAQDVAVTRITEESEWVSLMVSKQSFVGNTKIEAEVCLGEEGYGIGFLLSIPEATDRTDILEGYCLWISDDESRTTRLLKSGVEVIHASDIFLKRKQWYKIRLEKIEKTIHLYINDILQFSYIAHIPLIGTHVGLLSRDADYEIGSIHVYVGSLSIMVNCLAVPDAFFARRDYTEALSEYRRIAYSFHDRAEGREATFRAGLTFIEQAKESAVSHELLDEALREFEKLHGTPGAPLEYLGKALVYERLHEDEEEIKCFELAYRRYPKHPLLPVLQEQIISRMHEVSRRQRRATYRFILLCIRHLPCAGLDTHTRRLFNSLQKHWEVLPFIEENGFKNSAFHYLHFAIPLSFWLAKPYILGEILNDLMKSAPPCLLEIGNALFAILELGSVTYGKEKLGEVQKELANSTPFNWKWLEASYAAREKPLEYVLEHYFNELSDTQATGYIRSLFYFMDQANDQFKMTLVHESFKKIDKTELSFESKLQLNTRLVWAYLLENNWQKAAEIIYSYPAELLNNEKTPFHFLYGCWLQATEGTEMAHLHFTGLLSVTYPPTWTLASYFVIDALPHNWFEKAFLWEKKELYRQLALYYHCANQNDKKSYYYNLFQKETTYPES